MSVIVTTIGHATVESVTMARTPEQVKKMEKQRIAKLRKRRKTAVRKARRINR